MVAQQANMALMLLGKLPHPETGEIVTDLETAQFFVEQLEMLAVKTKGNLTKPEEDLLKKSLAVLRMAFVEAMQAPADLTSKIMATGDPGARSPITGAPAPGSIETPATHPAPADAPVPPAPASPDAAPKPSDPDEHRKRFSKKY
jgi:hypothetical protein